MDDLRTLHSLVDQLTRHGDGPAVLALRKQAIEEWSYADLTGYVRRLAHGFTEASIGQGDHVALLAAGRPEWIVACLAAIQAGAVAVPIDVQLGEEMLKHVLNDSGSRVVCTTADQAARLARLKLSKRPQLILLDAEEDDARSWRRLLSDTAGELPQCQPDETAVLFYTSGTTGLPKGVPLTHSNLVFQLNALRQAGLVREDDRVLLPLPLHHVYPFVGMLASLLFGLPIILPQALTGPQMIRALHEGQVTVIIGVPRLYRALEEGIEARLGARHWFVRTLFNAAIGISTWLRRRFWLRLGKVLLRPLHRQFGPKLRVLVSGGAALDPELAWKLEGLGWQVATGYGLTETSPMLTLDPPGQARIGSVGRPLPNVEIRIDLTALSRSGSENGRARLLPSYTGNASDSAGASPSRSDREPSGTGSANSRGEPDAARLATPTSPAKPNEEREIQARGPGVFAGYHGLPDETAPHPLSPTGRGKGEGDEAFTPNGWFRTGDLGYLDADGYLYITGRVKTLIVAEGGEKSQPDQVEEAYQAQPALREVGVLQKDGRLVAVIVPEASHATVAPEGKENDLDRVVRTAVEEQSKRMPSYQRLSDYVLSRQALPRTQLGKIQRHKLDELYEQLKQGTKPGKEVAGPMPVEEMTPDDRALLESPAAQQVWDWLASRFPDRRLAMDTSPQLDLGIDSMEWLNLTLEIRGRAGVELTEEAIGEIATVRDLLRVVAEQVEAGGSEGVPRASPLEQPEEALSERQKRWLRPLGPIAALLARALFGLDRLLLRWLFQVRVEGLEHLPENGPYVLVPNHVSHIDSGVLAGVLDNRRLRQTYWAGWTGGAFANPLMRLFSRLTQVVPVDAARGAISSLAFGAAVLKRGQSLVWYPEGGRSRSGQLETFKPGIGVLLHHFRVPVVPVFLEGTRAALPPGAVVPRPGHISVRFGPPLDPRELEQEGEGEEPHERIAHALHDRVAELGRDADIGGQEPRISRQDSGMPTLMKR